MGFTDRTGSATDFNDRDVGTDIDFDDRGGTAPAALLEYNNRFTYNNGYAYNDEGLGDQYPKDLEHGDISSFTDRSS